MLIAYVVISLSLLIGGVSSFFAILLGTRILLGIGEGLYYPMQNTIIKNWFPAGERGRANTAWILGQSLAPALAMPLYTWIIAEHSWRHIVISFGIGASSMQLPCVFTLLQSMVPAEAMSSAAGALNGMAVGFGALSPVLIGFILSVTHNFYFVMYILIGIVVIGGLFSLLFSRDRSRLLN